MGDRSYTFITGIETSDVPTQADPSADEDFVNLGYANTTYALREDFGYDVASYAALKALITTGDDKRSDAQIRLVSGTGETWRFDAGSSATDDGATILQPDVGTGRWLIISGATGSSGTGGLGLEALSQKSAVEQTAKIKTANFKSSVNFTPADDDAFSEYTARLAQDVASSATLLHLAWDPKVLNDSSQDTDATANWLVADAGATLTLTTTGGEFIVGTGALKFDKGTGNVLASIRYDRSSANLQIADHHYMVLSVNLPSLTDLSNIFVEIEDASGNTAVFEETTDASGDAFGTGWNQLRIDLSRTADSTAGSGWALGDLVRYVSVGVETGATSQTYTALIVDGVYFSRRGLDRVGPLLKEHTLNDGSNKEDVILSTAESGNYGDGAVVISSGLTNAYSGGIGGALLSRNTLVNLERQIGFDDANNSGAVGMEQEHRQSSVFTETYNGTIDGFIDFDQAEVFDIASVAVGSLTVADYSDLSANVLDTNVFDVFTKYFDRDEASYVWKEAVTMDANSSWLSDVLTIPVVSEGTVAVGDLLVKRAVSAEMSLVAATAIESFSSFGFETDPNGKLFFNASQVVPHIDLAQYWWKLGGPSKTYAYANRGSFTNTAATDLAQSGADSEFSEQVRDGFWALNNNGSTIASDDAVNSVINGNATDGRVEFLMWIKMPSTLNASTTTLMSCLDAGGNNGWACQFTSGTTLRIQGQSAGAADNGSTVSVPASVLGKWSLLRMYLDEPSNSIDIWWGGNVLSTSAPTIGGGATDFTINTNSVNPELRLSDLIMWGGQDQKITDADCARLSAAVIPTAFGVGGTCKYQFSNTSQSGQKLTMKAITSRGVTTETGPRILRYGAIKG